MKNINVVIGIRRLRLYKETQHHPAPNLTAIDNALAFVENQETPLDIVKVGLHEGFPVLYYTKSHKNNIVRIRFTEDDFYVKSYINDDEGEEEVMYTDPSSAAGAVIEAIEAYVDRQSSYNDKPAFRRPRRNSNPPTRGRYRERRGDAPTFRTGTVNRLEDLGSMVESPAQ